MRACVCLWYGKKGEGLAKTVMGPQALVSFKKYMPPPLPNIKVNICPFPLPHFASIFFAYLWSFRWPSYIVTLPRYFSFRLSHLNTPTGPPSAFHCNTRHLMQYKIPYCHRRYLIAMQDTSLPYKIHHCHTRYFIAIQYTSLS